MYSKIIESIKAALHSYLEYTKLAENQTGSPYLDCLFRDSVGMTAPLKVGTVNMYEANMQAAKQQLQDIKDGKIATREQVATLSDDIDEQLEQAYQRAEENHKDAKPSVWQRALFDSAKPMVAGPTITSYDGYYALLNNDKDVTMLRSAKYAIKDARDILTEADKSIQEGNFDGFVKGVGRGLGNKLFDARTWDMGASDIEDNTNLLKVLEKADAEQELTSAEKALLDAKSVEMAVNAYFGSHIGRGYKAGSVTAESLPFMLEMMINPASGIGKSGGAMLTRYALKRFGKESLKRNMKKYIATKVGTRVFGDAVGATTMAVTSGAGHSIADATGRMIGDVQFKHNEETGDVEYAGREGQESDFGTALIKGVTATGIQNNSEMVSAYFAPALGIISRVTSKGLQKIGLDGVVKFIDDVNASDVAKLVSDFQNRTQWNGTISEYAEEVVGNIENALIVGDMQFDSSENGVFNLDQNIDTFLGVSLMGGFMSGVKTVGYRTPKYRARQEMENAGKAIAANIGEANKELWLVIQEEIEEGDAKAVHAAITDVLSSKEVPEGFKGAVLDYARKAQKYRGILEAERKKREDENTDPMQTDAETSFDNGYTLATAEEMNDAKNMLEFKEWQMRQAFGLQEGESLPWSDDIVADINNGREEWTPEQTKAAIGWMNAKATYDGMIQRIRDDIDRKKVDAVTELEQHISKTDGMVHPATMKVDNRQVYIIGGNIRMFDDGSMVDAANSDNSVMIRDAKTGKVEMVAPRDVLSVDTPIDPTEEINTAITALREEIARTEAAKIDGEVSFAPGSKVSMQNEDGSVSEITIVGDAVDKDGNPVEGVVTVATADGQQVQMQRAAIQEGADAANKQRVIDYVAQQRTLDEADEPKAQAGQFDYKFDDRLTLRTPDGGTVGAVVTAVPNIDGVVLMLDEDVPGMQRAPQYTAEELSRLVVAQERDGQQIFGEAEGSETQLSEHSTPESISAQSETNGGIIGRSMSENEASFITVAMEEHAEVAPEIELTPENWEELFGQDGTVSTPIGNVKMGDNQYLKLAQRGREGKLGMVKPTLENPDVIIEDEREAKDDNSERNTSYVFIKTFTKEDGNRYYHFTSVTVSKDGREVVISNQERSSNRISKLLQQGKVTWINTAFSLHPTTQIEESVPLNDSNRPTATDNQSALLGFNSSELSTGKDNATAGIEQTEQPISAIDRIPKDENGEPMFESVSVADTWAAVFEENENDEAESIDTAKQLADVARKELEKAANQKPKGNTYTAIQNAKKEKRERMQSLQHTVDYWDAVADYTAAERRKAEETARNERRMRLAEARQELAKKGRYVRENEALGDYLDFRDYVMRAVATGAVRFKWGNHPTNASINGLGSHLGLSESRSEMGKRIWMLNNEDGMYPEAAAEYLLQGYREATGVEDVGINEMDSLSEMLDVLQSYDTPSAMFAAAQERHGVGTVTGQMSQEELEAAAYDEMILAEEADAMNMSPDEWADYLQYIGESISEYAANYPDAEVLAAFTEAEELINQSQEYEQSTGSEEVRAGVLEGQRPESGNRESVGVLPRETIDNAGTGRSSETEGSRRDDSVTAESVGDVSAADAGETADNGFINEQLTQQYKEELERIYSIENDEAFEMEETKFSDTLPERYSTRLIEGRPVIYNEKKEWEYSETHTGKDVVRRYNSNSLQQTPRKFKVGDKIQLSHEGSYPVLIVSHVDSKGRIVDAKDIENGRIVIESGRIKTKEEILKSDKQGNEIDENGHLVTENVKNIDELTDEDFTAPTRSVELPALPESVSAAIGSNGKPVVIKKSIFRKNRDSHKELSPKDSRDILIRALYNPNLVGQSQPVKRPDYRVVIQIGDKNSVVVLDVFQGNENIEVVGWRRIDAKGLDKMKRQAEREGGQILILSPNDGSAAALSALPRGLSSTGKGSESSETAKENDGINASYTVEQAMEDMGRIEEEWNEKIQDYIFEHYPTQATLTADTTSPRGLAEREAMRKDETLRKMREEARRAVDEADKKVSDAIRREDSNNGIQNQVEETQTTPTEQQTEATDAVLEMLADAGVEVVLDEKEMAAVLEANEQLQEMKKSALGNSSSTLTGTEIIEKIRNSKSAEITGDEITPSDDLKQYKKNALEYGKTLQGTYTNKDTGAVVHLQRGRRNGGINEVLQHDYKDVEHLQSIAAIPQIIENGIYIASEANSDAEKNPTVSEYQHFVCGLRIDGEDYTVRSVYAVDKNGDRYYDHKLTHIEKGKLLDRLVGITNPGFSQATDEVGFGTTPGTKPTTDVSDGKDNKLISLLKGLVSENSSPLQLMTVYHGSGAAFDAFDHSHMGEGEGAQAYGWGTYVTEVEGIARTYAGAMARRGNHIQYDGEPFGDVLDNEYYFDDAWRSWKVQIMTSTDIESLRRNIQTVYLDVRIASPRSKRRREFERQKKELLADIDNGRITVDLPRNIYTVEIPEDNGKNYLEWGIKVSDEHVGMIYRALRQGNIVLPNADMKFWNGKSVVWEDGRNLYFYLASEFGSDKSASEFLSKAGFVGIKYPAQYQSGGREDNAKNYVIFNESDSKITERIQFLRTERGEVYGFVKNGKIYLDPKLLNPNTPIHEYTHIWDMALQKSNPELWARGVELMKQTSLWDEVKNNPAYADIAEDDNLVASEVHARLTGKEGAALLERLMNEANAEKDLFKKAEKISLADRLRRWINEAWQWVKDTMTPWTKEEADVVNLEEFVNMPIADLARKVTSDSPIMGRDAEYTPVQYRFIGEKGAANADKAEEATTRLDNLAVAREMESAFEEKKKRIEKLRNSEAIQLNFNNEYELNRESAKKWMKDNIRGEYTNADTGEKIEVSKAGINEVTSHGSNDKAHLKSLSAIPQMIEQSVFIDERPNYKDHDKYDNYRYYVCGLKIDGEDYTAKIVVGVKGDKKYYDHRLTQIEKGTLIDNLNGLSNSVAENQNASVSVGKDSKLLSILQSDDKENARRIKMATGWERGADGKWRYETHDARITDELHFPDGTTHKRDSNDMLWNGGRLSDVIDDAEFFDAYPELAGYRIETDDITNDSPSNGYFDPTTKTIVIHATNLKYMNEILNHEIQHAIQHIEGFALGGNENTAERLKSKASSWAWRNSLVQTAQENPDASQAEVEQILIDEYKQEDMEDYLPGEEERLIGFNLFARGYDKEGYEDAYNWVGSKIGLSENGFKVYKRILGEVEARNVQKRMNMTPEERRVSLAAETEDVAREDQIFMFRAINGDDVSNSKIEDVRDAEYMFAVERGDMETAQRLVNEAAEEAGYSSDTSYQGSIHFNGAAPSSNAYFETKEERKQAWENDEWEGDQSLGDFVDGGIDNNDLQFTLYDPRAKRATTRERVEAIDNLRKAIESGNGKIKVYRAVDANISEDSIRNGDWITPSKSYAELHIGLQSNWDNGGRIIEQEVSIDDIWWDGNDIAEWGYDDGKGYAYKNTANNRKLLDTITRDEDGNVIPLSKRFNQENEDVRYRSVGGNSGYVGYSISKRGAKAKEEGRYPKGEFKREYGVTSKSFEFLVDNDFINNSEWHHTSKFGNKTNFYGWAEPYYADVYAENKTEIDKLCRSDKKKEEILSQIEELFENSKVANEYREQKRMEEILENNAKKESALRNKYNSEKKDALHLPYHASNGVVVSEDFHFSRNGNPMKDTNPKGLEAIEEYKGKFGDIKFPTFEEWKGNNESTLMRGRVAELSSLLGVDIEVVENGRGLEGKKARAKGWFDKRTGKISVVLGNHASVEDIEKTVLHEAVAHYGLRQLFGENFDLFLYNVFNNASPEVRREIAALMSKNNWDYRTATEEYLAGLAERTNFEEARSSGWWQKIKDFFAEMLAKAGFKGDISDNELRYVLWRSYENLKNGGINGIFAEAADIATQYDLGVGEFEDSIRAVNERFNAELDAFKRKQHKGLLHLGKPKKILKVCGIYKELTLSPTVLNRKLKQHSLSIDDLKGLAYAIQKPILAYVHGKNHPNIVVVTNLSVRGGRLSVSVELDKDGNVVEINNINSIHNKEAIRELERLSNMGEGDLKKSLRWVDKKKVSDWFGIADLFSPIHTNNPKLVSAANIVENFENPSLDAENDVLYRDAEDYERSMARTAYERDVERTSQKFNEAWVDSMVSLKKLQEEIVSATGKQMRDWENAYMAENRMSSINLAEMDAYKATFYKDLIDAVNALVKEGLAYEDIIDYMMARHGLERNEVLALRDAEATIAKKTNNLDKQLKKGEITAEAYNRHLSQLQGEELQKQLVKNRMKDYAGLTALFAEEFEPGEKPSVRELEEKAAALIQSVESAYNTADLWSAVNAATKATLTKQYESGMIDRAGYEKIRDMYSFYIPLRGFDETTSDEIYHYFGSQPGTFGGTIRHAKGRHSKADDPIATIGNMAERSIMQGNRNQMKQHFLRFVLNHPSDAVSVSQLYLQYDAVRDEWHPASPDIKPEDSAEEVRQKMNEFNERMEELVENDPDNFKRAKDAVDIPYRVINHNLGEHQVIVKMGGKDYVLTINGNPRAAQALNGMLNPDNTKNPFLKFFTTVNHYLAASFTQKNPAFLISNLSRDAFYANTMVWVKESPAYAMKFHKNWGKALLTLGRLIRKQKNGTLSDGNDMERLFKEFVMNGGETGYTFMHSVDDYKGMISDALKQSRRSGWNPKTWLSFLNNLIDYLGRWTEDTSRFAAYVTSRESGRSIERSIWDAKEISVNFNKKGAGAKAAGEWKEGNRLNVMQAYTAQSAKELYVFWNAGVQGLSNFGRAFKNNKAKATAAAITYFSTGTLLPLLMQSIAAALGDEDDDYYNLPEYVRRSHLCIYTGSGWVTIPLSIELRAFYGLGEMLMGQITGKTEYKPAELATQMLGQVSQLLPIDFMEGGGAAGAFIPSYAKPFYELHENTDWTGMPIYKDTPFNENMPEWTKAYKGTNKQMVNLARMLNEATGGDEVKAGFIDINPAAIEHIFEGYTGGVGKFVNQTMKLAQMPFDPDLQEMRNVPVLSSFFRTADERTQGRSINNEYFRLKEEHDETMRVFNGYEQRADMGLLEYARKADFMYNSREFKRAEMMHDYILDIDYLNREKKYLTDDEVKEIELEQAQIKKEMVELMKAEEADYGN